MLLKLYAVSYRLHERLGEAIRIGFQGMWLGLLTRETLSRIDERYYDTAPVRVSAPDATYTSDVHNLGGLRDWEQAALAAHFPPAGRVVVTGAGAGREIIALMRTGYDAAGYEPHAGLVASGRELLAREGLPDALAVSRYDMFPADAGDCDAVIVGWGSYGLIAGRSRRVDFLRAARAALRPGSPILLSFYTREAGAVFYGQVARVANVFRRVRRTEPAEPGDTLTPMYVHRFTAEDVRSELTEAGFELIGFSPTPYGHAVGRAV